MSAGIYKTPGVYVEEIPKFPPSIAPVETAVPAFIGYTEKALKEGKSITQKATVIESIAEFEQYFGTQSPQKVEIYLNSSDAYENAQTVDRYLMYDSLRMFYANGGGKCYILSIGGFNAKLKQNFIDGIGNLEEEDEPTIIVFPDASLLGGTDLYDIQVAALAQCKKLMDRVTLCDTKYSGELRDHFKTDVTELRDKIGVNNLKYGVAYGPWIKANLPRIIKRRDIILKTENTGGSTIELKSLTTDKAIHQVLFDTVSAENAVDALKKSEEDGAGGIGKKWEDELKKQSDAYNLALANPAKDTVKKLEGDLQVVYGVLTKVLSAIKGVVDSLPVVDAVPDSTTNKTKEFNLKGAIEQQILAVKLKDKFDILAAHYNFLKVNANGDTKLFNLTEDANGEPKKSFDKAIALLGYADFAAFEAIAANPPIGDLYAGKTEKEKASIAKNAGMKISDDVIAFYRFVQNSAGQYETQFNDALINNFGFYKDITTKATEALNLLPPSGAVAGVYATTDRERGVWKAPANVSLNSVLEPAVKVSHEQQAGYNVDVNAGKSINIIRFFTNKGTLVWGARTLAGNDNEWRYISVRRFFNFVEESVKKATEQFVFEPNDANTWVKVQAMIENFLTTQWRQGALQGVKPEHAFYVAVGLGKTMTPLDILEGRMIIEIGMAAVRPAEFIILRFSHKLAES